MKITSSKSIIKKIMITSTKLFAVLIFQAFSKFIISILFWSPWVISSIGNFLLTKWLNYNLILWPLKVTLRWIYHLGGFVKVKFDKFIILILEKLFTFSTYISAYFPCKQHFSSEYNISDLAIKPKIIFLLHLWNRIGV